MKNKPLYKGSLSTIILKLLEENSRMYGYEITQKVKELTAEELNITEGALYPSLHRLEAEGLLRAEMVRIGNRMRKYYTLTDSGKKETADKLGELKAFVEQMQLILNTNLAKPHPL
jgi:DNA-binding PadR family transcriptional regulator